MNEDAVYVKTEAGEDAVSKRTIVQRNLRSVLIMIDGRTPVGNLAQQFGDPLIIEGLVGELEHRGLIRRVDGAKVDSDADRSALSSIMVDIEDLISQPITPVADDIRRAHERSSTAASPLLDEFAVVLPELAAPMPVEPKFQTQPEAANEDVRSAIRRAMISAENAAPSDGADARGGGSFRRALDLLAGRVRGAQRPGPPGSVARRLIVGGGVIVVLLVAVFFLYPYSRHLPQMEQTATELLGQPVRIAAVSPSLFPEPSIALEGVTVGEEGKFEIGVVKLIPRVSTLLAERTVMREIRIERAGLNIAFLPDLSRPQGINWSSRWLEVERVSVVDSSLLLLDGALSRLQGTLTLNEDGALTQLSLTTADGALNVDAAMESGTWKLVMKALGWQTPGSPSLLFDVFEASGTLTSQQLQLDKVDIKLYDGYAVGSLALDWGEATRVEGEITTSRLNIEGLTKVFAPTLLVVGDLSATVSIKGEGATLADVQRSLSASGKLGVQRGKIERVDLVQAVRIPRLDGVRGGNTRFDELDAEVVADAGGLSLTSMVIQSGLVGAAGTVRLADGRINGRLDVSLQSSAASVRAPVSISGTYADPVVRLLR